MERDDGRYRWLKQDGKLALVSPRASLPSSSVGALLIRLIQTVCLVGLAYMTYLTLTSANFRLTIPFFGG